MFVRAATIAVAVFVGAAAAVAASVEIEQLTWIEVRDRVAAGSTTVLIPTGGTEQNGRHMVIGKHNRIVAETARRIATELGDALVAPVLAYTPEGSIEPSTGHMAYAGTVSLPEPVFEAVIEAAARSLKAHGFKTIVFVGDSGPNQAPQDAVAARLSEAWAGEDVRVLNASGYYAGNGGERWLQENGAAVAGPGAHAGLRDTSELLAVDPAGVHLDRIAPDRDGASGDASGASAKLGEALLALKVKTAVAEIRAAQTSSRSASPGLIARLWRRIAG